MDALRALASTASDAIPRSTSPTRLHDNSHRRSCHDESETCVSAAGKRKRGNDFLALAPILLETSPDAIVMIDRSTLKFEMSNSAFAQFATSMPEGQEKFHASLKSHLFGLFGIHANSQTFKEEYPTRIGSARLNICAAANAGSDLVVVILQDPNAQGLNNDFVQPQARMQQTPTQMLPAFGQGTLPPAYSAANPALDHANSQRMSPGSLPASYGPESSASTNVFSQAPLISKLNPMAALAGQSTHREPAPVQVSSDTAYRPRSTATRPAKKSKQDQLKPWIGKMTRKPYRFCVYCWIMEKEWKLKALTSPDGQNIQIGGHTQMVCPVWPSKALEPTPEQQREYGAAFKRASRKNFLHDKAFVAFKIQFPDMDDASIHAFLSPKVAASPSVNAHRYPVMKIEASPDTYPIVTVDPKRGKGEGLEQ